MAGFEDLLMYEQCFFSGRPVGQGIAANRHVGLDGGEQFPAHATAFYKSHRDNQHNDADGNGNVTCSQRFIEKGTVDVFYEARETATEQLLPLMQPGIFFSCPSDAPDGLEECRALLRAI